MCVGIQCSNPEAWGLRGAISRKNTRLASGTAGSFARTFQRLTKGGSWNILKEILSPKRGESNAKARSYDLRPEFRDYDYICSKGTDAGTGRNRNDDVPGDLLRYSQSRKNDGPNIQRRHRTAGPSCRSRRPHVHGTINCPDDRAKTGQRTCSSGSALFGQSCRWC